MVLDHLQRRVPSVPLSPQPYFGMTSNVPMFGFDPLPSPQVPVVQLLPSQEQHNLNQRLGLKDIDIDAVAGRIQQRQMEIGTIKSVTDDILVRIHNRCVLWLSNIYAYSKHIEGLVYVGKDEMAEIDKHGQSVFISYLQHKFNSEMASHGAVWTVELSNIKFVFQRCISFDAHLKEMSRKNEDVY